MESQLRNIFDEEIQVQRIAKEISILKGDSDIKNLLQWRMSFIRKQQLILHFTIKQNFMKKYKLERIKDNVLLKIIYLNSYPYMKPKIYFMSNNLNQLYTVNTRDYFDYYFPQWTQKNNISQIIFKFPNFYNRIEKQKQLIKIGKYHKNQYIEIQPLYNQSVSQFYPIQILLNPYLYQSYLIINKFDFIMLTSTGINNYMRLVDIFPLFSIKNILRSKNNDKQMVIMIKWKQFDGGFQFITSDSENIIQSIINRKKAFPKFKQQQIIDKPKEKIESKIPIKNVKPPSLEVLTKQIMVCQQKLSKELTKQNLDKLILVYNQAIQLESQNNSTNYKKYLNKMQNLLLKQQISSLMGKPKNNTDNSIFEFFKQSNIKQQSQIKTQKKLNSNKSIDLL